MYYCLSYHSTLPFNSSLLAMFLLLSFIFTLHVNSDGSTIYVATIVLRYEWWIWEGRWAAKRLADAQ